MPSKTSSSGSVNPPLGTLIDDGSIELVEVLGVGGYGVVYRAVDTRSSLPKSYAVKCLEHPQPHQNSRQRQIHIREITLHQLASAHPNVVTLHRVVEDYAHTYIIMDYASDGDLFSQILYNCRYLGDDYLIKHIFLQLLDAVEYCHSLGIYHRDLKPENILCFDGGIRVAITDFGLATTDKVSEEFRTGSVYHMSPECQGGEFAPTGTYSPMFNDIWSLAIILLNLATGRNPWKSATASDPTFQAYLRDPLGFLPTVLPISLEINAILTRMLEVDWRDRMTLPELRQAMEDVNTFYSDGVVFEGSMARCPWESGMEIDSDCSTREDDPPMPRPHTQDLKSHWSKDSTSDMIFASQSAAEDASYVQWAKQSSCGATWAYDSSNSSDSHHDMAMYDPPLTPESTRSPMSPMPGSIPSMPVTPAAVDVRFDNGKILTHLPPLTVNTDFHPPRYYARNSSVTSFSTGSSMMQTAIEYNSYSSSFFLASPGSPTKQPSTLPSSVDFDARSITEDKDMDFVSTWDYSSTAVSPSIFYKNGSISAHAHDTKSPAPSSDPIVWPEYRSQNPPQRRPLPVFSMMSESSTTSSISPPPQRAFLNGGKAKVTGLFNPIKFFPRSTPSLSRSRDGASSPPPRHSSDPYPSPAFRRAPSPASPNPWAGFSIPRARSPTLVTADRNCGRTTRLRSARHWFSPGKFFAAAGAS